MNLEKLNLVELDAHEANVVSGGELTVWDLIMISWNGTPDGYNATWQWQSDGSWGASCYWHGDPQSPC